MPCHRMRGAAGCLTVFLLISGFFGSVSAQIQPAADFYVAVVVKVKPPVTIQRQTATQLAALQEDSRLYPGDRVICGEGGYASLLFADNGVEIKLLSNTEITFQGQRSSSGIVKRLFLQIGNLLTHVVRGDMEVVTPTCVASVKGTQWWTTVDRSAQTSITVLEGQVKVKNPVSGAVELVNAGSTATSTSTGQVQVQPTQAGNVPQQTLTPEGGTLEFEFEDGSGEIKTLHIDFDK
jgi:hypothetical protein